MKQLIILAVASLTLAACDYSKETMKVETIKSVDLMTVQIPEECIDESGVYDPDLGTDTIDCDTIFNGEVK